MKSAKPTKKSIEKELFSAVESVLSTHKIPAKKIEKDLHPLTKRIAKRILKEIKKGNPLTKKETVKKPAKGAGKKVRKK